MSNILLLRRRLMGTKESGGLLPSGYTQLEYLENALGKSAYFNTGLKTSTTFGFEVDAMFYDAINSTNTALFGGRYAANNRDVGIMSIAADNRVGELRLGGASNKFNANLTQNTRFTASLLNGVFTTSTDISTNVTYGSSQNCHINVFCQGGYNNTDPLNNSHGRIYSLKFYSGSELTRHYIPCIDPNNVYGMYDLVTETFTGSAASDAFTGA